MIDLWPAVGLAAATMAFLAVRQWLQLQHGRLLTADRAQAQDRAITQLELRAKKNSDELEHVFKKLDTFARDGELLVNNLRTLHDRLDTIDTASLDAKLDNLAANEAKFMSETVERIVKIEQTQAMALQGLVGNRKPQRLGHIPP
jgi:hypothetical protein